MPNPLLNSVPQQPADPVNGNDDVQKSTSVGRLSETAGDSAEEKVDDKPGNTQQQNYNAYYEMLAKKKAEADKKRAERAAQQAEAKPTEAKAEADGLARTEWVDYGNGNGDY